MAASSPLWRWRCPSDGGLTVDGAARVTQPGRRASVSVNPPTSENPMDDPFERHLRSLMQDSSAHPTLDDDKRPERVFDRAHIRSGLVDVIQPFANWGWVLGEGGARGLRHGRPVRRARDNSSSSDLNS